MMDETLPKAYPMKIMPLLWEAASLGGLITYTFLVGTLP